MSKRFKKKLGEVDVPMEWMFVAVSKKTEYIMALGKLYHGRNK